MRHVVWIVIPEANPKFIFWVLPVCVRYTHRLFALPPHIIPHICRSVVSETLGADLPTPTLTAQIDPVQSRAEARKPPFYNGSAGSVPTDFPTDSLRLYILPLTPNPYMRGVAIDSDCACYGNIVFTILSKLSRHSMETTPSSSKVIGNQTRREST